MTLHQYLKGFKNVAWYPSCDRDPNAFGALSKRSLFELGVRGDYPDCFIYTDYLTHIGYNGMGRFVLDLDARRGEFDVPFAEESRVKATAYNVIELAPLKLGFDRELVVCDPDRYYGRVFACDVLVEDERFGRSITKLVCVIAENTAFAVDFLLKKGTRVRYVIHSAYGHGFGCGRSNGAFLPSFFRDLGTKYFLTDMVGEPYYDDIADKYVTEERKGVIPVLRARQPLGSEPLMHGYGPTYLYEIVGFQDAPIGFKERYIVDRHCRF